MSDSSTSTDPFLNPYAAPAEVGGRDPYQLSSTRNDEELAGRGTRLAAAMLDSILVMLVVIPAQIFSGFTERVQSQTAGVGEQIFFAIFGFAVLLLFNGYLLATRGQTIGKALTKIQIIDRNSTHLVSLATIVMYRYLWILPFTILVIFIPGASDDILIQILAIIDVLLIFGASRRCLHDYIAGTRVVNYVPGRTTT